MFPPHPLAPWMVQGTSPAPPYPYLGRRGGQGLSPLPLQLLGAGSGYPGRGLAQRAPYPLPQAQLLHKNNGAPAPGVGEASRKGPRYGYRGSNLPTTFWGAGEVPSFPVPVMARRSAVLVKLGAPAPAEEKVSLCPQCGEEGRELCQAVGVGSHFRRPLALRSPVSLLGLPSSVDDVVGSVCPQRAISACSATEAATASSQPFISS